MDKRVYHLRLPDGRRIACSEYGAPAGHPVIYCHGFPSSRHEALLLQENALAEGARVIAIDRPGYGESDYQPGRAILDWPADVAAVADQLDLEQFALIGVSGGGPYALACAARIPERLSACALVCALGPIYLDELLATMHWAARSQLAMAKNTPMLSHIVFGALTAGILAHWPETVENFRALSAPQVDRRELEKGPIRSILNTTIRDAVRSGARGARQDLMLYTRPWRIPFDQIRFPVRLWHGEVDGTVPAAHSRWYAAHLPQATASYLPNEGHYSLPLRRSAEILRAMLHPESGPVAVRSI
jgi:pimeloyl-ACP methyl ester carboxylesterase